MRLSPNLKFLVALATIAPLVGIFLSGAFMAAVAVGLWDHWAKYLPMRTVESIGWSGMFVLGTVFATHHFILVVFYISHIITNHAAPGPGRILFAVGIFLVPRCRHGSLLLPLHPPRGASPLGVEGIPS